MFYQVVSVIIVNDLCDFYDLYTSLSVTFVMYFSGRNKDIYFIFLASFSCSCLLCSKKYFAMAYVAINLTKMVLKWLQKLKKSKETTLATRYLLGVFQ